MPRTRPRPARTKRTNRRPPLKISTLSPQDFSFWEGEIRSIMCPDCRVWRRVMGETALRIRDHGDHRSEGYVQCSGANQALQIDIDLEEWGQQVHEADATVKGRRATKVARKPKAMRTEPVSPMTRSTQSLGVAQRAYTLHRENCSICQGAGRDSVRACCDAVRLANTYVERLKQEPQRAELGGIESREQARRERRLAAEARERSAAEWHRQSQITVTPKALTKRSGTGLEERNNLFRSIPGTTSERGRPVPIEPPRIR